MARENQGLQIALIVFVVLTILFAVTTFMFFRKSKERSILQEAARASERAAKEAPDSRPTERKPIEKPLSPGPRPR